MKPIRNQVLFKPLPADEISEGGIYVPLSARRVSNKGIIVATGNGTPKKPMTVKAGQTAIRVKDWGCEVLINGEKHYLMDADSILAVEN